MDTPPPNFQFWQMLLYPLFAAFGGLLGYALRTMDAGRQVSLWRALIESLSAGFVGVLVLLLCQALSLSPQWTGFLVGVLGWLGAAASIRILEKVVRNKLGVPDNDGVADDKA